MTYFHSLSCQLLSEPRGHCLRSLTPPCIPTPDWGENREPRTEAEWIDVIYYEFHPKDRPLELHEDEKMWLGSRVWLQGVTTTPLS